MTLRGKRHARSSQDLTLHGLSIAARVPIATAAAHAHWGRGEGYLLPQTIALFAMRAPSGRVNHSCVSCSVQYKASDWPVADTFAAPAFLVDTMSHGERMIRNATADEFVSLGFRTVVHVERGWWQRWHSPGSVNTSWCAPRATLQ